MLPLFCRKQFGTKKEKILAIFLFTTNKSSIKNKRGVNKVLNDVIESSVLMFWEISLCFVWNLPLLLDSQKHPNWRDENRSEKNKNYK